MAVNQVTFGSHSGRFFDPALGLQKKLDKTLGEKRGGQVQGVLQNSGVNAEDLYSGRVEAFRKSLKDGGLDLSLEEAKAVQEDLRKTAAIASADTQDSLGRVRALGSGFDKRFEEAKKANEVTQSEIARVNKERAPMMRSLNLPEELSTAYLQVVQDYEKGGVDIKKVPFEDLLSKVKARAGVALTGNENPVQLEKLRLMVQARYDTDTGVNDAKSKEIEAGAKEAGNREVTRAREANGGSLPKEQEETIREAGESAYREEQYGKFAKEKYQINPDEGTVRTSVAPNTTVDKESLKDPVNKILIVLQALASKLGAPVPDQGGGGGLDPKTANSTPNMVIG